MPVYRALTAVLAPLARRRLERAARDYPALAGRAAERLGDVPEDHGALWTHAASVGELNAAAPLIDRLLQVPDRRIVLSNLTATAASQASLRYANVTRIDTRLAPLDRPVAVRRWLDRTRPRALLLIETELWPVLLDACHHRGIPVAMANARLSENAAVGYRRARGLFQPLLADIHPIACQTRADADRFMALGARADSCRVTGNVKFDCGPAPALPDDVERIARGWKGRPVWIAGSTHAGEETLLARAHRRVLEQHPEALLVLVPRHPERAPEARSTLERADLRVAALDGHSDGTGADAIVVGRLGILAGLYSTGRVSFVGGSLVDGIGGHNVVEAARAGRPVLTGPHTADQREAADGLERAGALVRVQDSAELAEAMIDLFTNRERAGKQVANAEEFLAGQRGALDRTVAVLDAWLESL